MGCTETPVYHKVPQDELNLLITFICMNLW